MLTLPFTRRSLLLFSVTFGLAVGNRGAAAEPTIVVRSKPVLQIGGLHFKDLNANGTLDPYEDWRQPVAARVADLVARLTLEEKAGLMLIDTLNAEPGGIASAQAVDFVQRQQMSRFIFRNPVTATPDGQVPKLRLRGAQVTPREAAQFTNLIQEMREGTRLGIPAIFKSNARNHYDRDARGGINEPAGSLSEWPKEAGLAATRDPETWRRFAATMGAEWNAIGLRGAYAYMADLATEPRWYRVHETFTEDSDLAADIMRELVLGLQGGPVSRDTRVALTAPPQVTSGTRTGSCRGARAIPRRAGWRNGGSLSPNRGGDRDQRGVVASGGSRVRRRGARRSMVDRT